MLPALNRRYRFTKSGVTSDPTRVLLTDGGVFENLGASPMEPGREPSISTNVFNPAYIISCDAGTGLFEADSYPMWWAGRMRRSFQAVFRKTQDATRNRLHQHTDAGDIAGFALSYLGQDDDRIALRGELLTRLHVAYYLPEI